MQTEVMNPEDMLDWIAFLKVEVAKEGKSVSSVAKDIGMPRPSLSMLINDTYPGELFKVTAKYRSKVLSMYRAQLHCPYIAAAISLARCRHNAGRPASTSNPARIRQQNACRACPQNPIQTAENGTSKGS